MHYDIVTLPTNFSLSLVVINFACYYYRSGFNIVDNWIDNYEYCDNASLSRLQKKSHIYIRD